MTLLLSARIDINKDPQWLGDQSLVRGVTFAVSRGDHQVNALFVNSRTVSPGTSNLVAMRQRRTDRSAFRRDQVDFLTRELDICASEGDQIEINKRF